MSLWWLQPGWDQATCSECGQRIAPEGDPDWGLCWQCMENRTSQQEYDQAMQEEYERELREQEPPPMTQPDPALVALVEKGLTEAQRKAVCWDREDNHPQWAGHISCWGDQAVADSLFSLGLTVAPETLVCLTPLGEAVRAIIIGGSHE